MQRGGNNIPLNPVSLKLRAFYEVFLKGIGRQKTKAYTKSRFRLFGVIGF